ncbi:hypothetical protein [Bacillus phage PK2]|nr:hypothetical protein [Bacillus phage PK2]
MWKDGTCEMVGGVYTYEIEVTHHYWTYEFEITKEYLEKKLPLRYVLQIIQKLSKDRGALSKQLYKYFGKAGSSKLRGDFLKQYKYRTKTDISNPEDRKHFATDWSVKYYKTTDWGHEDREAMFESICGKHLSRCLAILIDKGYLTSENKKFNRGFKRSSHTYTYSNTYYKLTDKAIKYLETK